MTAISTRCWFGQLNSRQDSHYLIFCLPPSGAGSSAFRGWDHALPPGLEIATVRLPGREQRFGEPPELRPDEVAAAIAVRADRPYVIFGHSLGARLGFDVIRVLRRRGLPLPLLFYAAAARPPDLDSPITRVLEYDDDRCVAELIELIDAPPQLRDEPELRELLLPVLRSDLGWLRSYVFRPERPLDVPLIALAGEADSECDPATMRGWARHTSASFRLLTVPGGHFFPQTHAGHVISLIAADLQVATAIDVPGPS